ncbi:MAG TPA: aldose epimerase family protein [Janthinobacterium sp.]|nr:aldose epimerase family protein [Janthinobacterium sp.]
MSVLRSASRSISAAGDARYTLRNARDMHVTISERGATLISWRAPDRYGRVADVLLAHADPATYIVNPHYFGATVGRWANRIAAGRFTLDGADYLVDRNDGPNHLHGGDTGFHQAMWRAHEEEDGALRFTLHSADGDGGYPGNLDVEVTFHLDDDGALRLDYQAVSDAPTPLNLTSHGYFNLSGGAGGIGDHVLSIAADAYLQVDAGLIPIGMAPVAGSAFDFRQAAPIGPRLGWPEPQLALGGGFDHCYCLRPAADGAAKTLREVARVLDPGSGRLLSVATTETGLQFYSGNFLAGVAGRDGRIHARHDGFCLEAQAWPNQINGPDAEAVVLRPGQVYRQSTIYKLEVQD